MRGFVQRFPVSRHPLRLRAVMAWRCHPHWVKGELEDRGQKTADKGGGEKGEGGRCFGRVIGVRIWKQEKKENAAAPTIMPRLNALKCHQFEGQIQHCPVYVWHNPVYHTPPPLVQL